MIIEDLRVAVVDCFEGSHSQIVEGYEKFLPGVCEGFKVPVGKLGNRSIYFRSSELFLKEWARTFEKNDFDMFMFMSSVRASDIVLVQDDYFGLLPMIYNQQASCFLMDKSMGSIRHRNRDVSELNNYLSVRRILVYTEYHKKIIAEGAREYFKESIASEIEGKIDVVLAPFDWENRISTQYAVSHDGPGVLTISEKLDLSWVPNRVEKVVELRSREEHRNNVPVIVWNRQLDSWSEPQVFVRIMKALDKAGIDFKINVTVPQSNTLRRFKKMYLEVFKGFYDKIKIVAVGPSKDLYHAILSSSDYRYAILQNDHYPLSVRDAACAGSKIFIRDCENWRMSIPEDGRELFFKSEEDCVVKFRREEKKRTGRWPVEIPDWVRVSGVYDMYMRYFSDVYREFYEGKRFVVEGKVKEMGRFIREKPRTKREIFDFLGWNKYSGWPMYKFKLRRMGIKSRKIGPNFWYFESGHEDRLEEEAKDRKQVGTLF